MTSSEPQSGVDIPGYRFATFSADVLAPIVRQRETDRPDGLGPILATYLQMEAAEATSTAALGASIGFFDKESVEQVLKSAFFAYDRPELPGVTEAWAQFLDRAANDTPEGSVASALEGALDRVWLIERLAQRNEPMKAVNALLLYADDSGWNSWISSYEKALRNCFDGERDDLGVVEWFSEGLSTYEAVATQLGLDLLGSQTTEFRDEIRNRESVGDEASTTWSLVWNLLGWRFGLDSDDAAARLESRFRQSAGVLFGAAARLPRPEPYEFPQHDLSSRLANQNARFLTSDESELLEHLLSGRPIDDIAEQVGMASGSVRSKMMRIREKLGQLPQFSRERGMG